MLTHSLKYLESQNEEVLLIEMLNPQHPGSLIAEYLTDNNVSLHELARGLGVSAPTLNKIVNGRASVTPAIAVRLEAGLGIKARLLLSMQAACDLNRAPNTDDVFGVQLYPGLKARPATNGADN